MCFKNCIKNQLTYSFVALFGIAAFVSGCGGGGGSGSTPSPQPPGVPITDLHSDTQFNATRFFVDNGSIIGSINTPGDIDVFTFNLTEGNIYALQLVGWPTTPSQWDLVNGGGSRYFLTDASGATTLGTTSTPPGGDVTALNTIPFVGSGPLSSGLVFAGDRRVMFEAPYTGSYFMHVYHNSVIGIGNYRLNVASSRFGGAANSYTYRYGRRDNIRIVSNDIPPETLVQANSVHGFVAVRFVGIDTNESVEPSMGFDFGITRSIQMSDGSAGDQTADPPELPTPPILFEFFDGVHPPDEFSDVEGEEDNILLFSTDPFVDEMHIHIGIPPASPLSVDGTVDNLSINHGDNATITTPTDPHPFAIAIDAEGGVSRGSQFSQIAGDRYQELVLEDETGEAMRIPVKVVEHEIQNPDGGMEKIKGYRVELGAERIFGSADISREQLRTLVGLRWYADVHYWDDFMADNLPVAYSHPNGGTALTQYHNNFSMSGFGAGVSQTITYDGSMNTFQIANTVYNGLDVFFDETDDTPVQTSPTNNVGFNLAIYEGAPGVTGPKLFDVGIVPASSIEAKYEPFLRGESGTIIAQLTDEQAQILREHFYNGNFYVALEAGGAVVKRAEWHELGFQLEPNDVIQPFGRSGSAYTRGKAYFVSEYSDGGTITVIANGKNLGNLTSTVAKDFVACGSENSGAVASAKFIPQEYYYKAFAEDGTEWDGFFTVEDDGCTTVVLEKP